MRIGGVLVAFVLCAPAAAGAQEVDLAAFPDITSRDFAIDLYQGSALGSGRIVGMGGAAVATAEGSAGMVANAASPAVRPATSTDYWDWDWHVDWLNPEIGSDFDNNGVLTTEELGVSPFFTIGGVLQFGPWAVGIASTAIRHSAGDLRPSFLAGQINVARTFLGDQLAVGIGGRIGSFELREQGQPRPLFSLGGGGLETGALWMPAEQNFRVGANLSLPMVGKNPEVTDCDPMNCRGFILPDEVRVPWRTSAGFAWRFGPTPWNRKVNDDWRDEKSVVVAGDLIVTGAVASGYGLEAFAAQKLQPSGRDVVFSVRAGAEYEWIPGRLRVRGGSYWEPARFLDQNGDAVAGRLHGTVGLDVRIWRFCFWGDRYRAQLSLTADGAEHYGNGALSVGLWH